MASSTTVNLKALGLNFSSNALELAPGSMLEANNVIIRRDDVVESRRGYKIFGEQTPSSEPIKQLMVYRDRILRHYGSKLAFQDGTLNDGTAKFTEFNGTFDEVEPGLRTKYIQSKNGNFYFTSDEGIKKISAATSNDLSAAAGYVTQAGGIKALDLDARINTVFGDQSSFFTENSVVAYKLVWGKIDENNVEVLGTPSERAIVYNPLKTLIKTDFLRLLSILDNFSSSTSLITDANYVSSLSVNADTNAIQLREKLVGLAEKIDKDMVFANSTGNGGSTAVTITIASPGVFTTSSNHNLSINDTVVFSTTGSLPTGVVAGTTYYVESFGTPAATTFKIKATLAGSAIATTGSQSGTHSFTSKYSPMDITAATASSGVVTVTMTPYSKPFGAADVSTSADTITIASHGFNTGDLVTLTGTLPNPLSTSTNYYVNKLSSSVAITIASPGIFTTPLTHNLAVNNVIVFSTTGTLPTGIVAGTTYYVKTTPSTTTFTVSATSGGSAINLTGTQSGVHSYVSSSTFQLTATLNGLPIDLTTTGGASTINKLRYFEIGKKINLVDFKSNNVAIDNLNGNQTVASVAANNITLLARDYTSADSFGISGGIASFTGTTSKTFSWGSTSTFNSSAHGFSDGDTVQLTNSNNVVGDLPAGTFSTGGALAFFTNYYVKKLTPDTFQLHKNNSLTDVFTGTDNGAGVHTITLTSSFSNIVVTTSTDHKLKDNQRVVLANTGNTNLDGSWIITTKGPTSFQLSTAVAGPVTAGSVGTWNISIDAPSATTTIENNEYRSIEEPIEIATDTDTGIIETRGTGAQIFSQQVYLNEIISKLKAETNEVISTAYSQLIGLSSFTTTTRASTTLEFTVPHNIDSTYYYKLYRTETRQVNALEVTPLEDALPSIDYRLALQTYYDPTQKTANNTLIIQDTVPVEFLNKENLYTNFNTSTAEEARPNDYPPFAKDINVFKGYTFYANTKLKQLKDLELLGVTAFKDELDAGRTPKLFIFDGTSQNYCTIEFVRGVKQVVNLSIPGSPSDPLTTPPASPTTNYLDINSAGNVKKYRIWFDLTGTDVAPAAASRILIKVYSPINTQDEIGKKLTNTLNTLIENFSSTYASGTVTINYMEDGFADAIAFGAGLVGYTLTTTTTGIGEDVASAKAVISSNDLLLPASATKLATKSFIRILNRNTASQSGYDTYAYYSELEQPGLFLLEGTRFIDDKYYIQANNNAIGFSFSPTISPDYNISSVLSPAVNVTISFASPAIFTTALAHGLVVNDAITFSTTGALPAPLTVGTTYYVRNITSPTQFTISTTIGGLEINTISSGSGTHQYTQVTTSFTPISFSSGVTTFDLNVSCPYAAGSKVIISNTNTTPNIDGIYTITSVSGTQFSVTAAPANGGGTQFNVQSYDNSEYSDNYKRKNRIYYSKFEQPEAVPVNVATGNFYDIGTEDREIRRIFPLRDSLFIFKEDGLYRLSSEFEPFTVALFDSNCILLAPDSVDSLQNVVYCWTTQGILAVSESGVGVASRPIDTEILRIQSANYPAFKTATFGVGYPSDNSYIVWSVTNSGDDYATQAFRYSTLTNTWTKYTKANSCGILNFIDDRLYLGLSSSPYMEQERKSFNRTDYADYEFEFILGPNFYEQSVLKLPSVSDVSIGDVITQNQPLTIYNFNSLLKKLDSDPGVADSDYYNTLAISGGVNLRSNIVALANKLDNDAGIAQADFYSTIQQLNGLITNISFDNAAVITTAVNHNLFTGRIVNLSGVVTTPDIVGSYPITYISPTSFSVPFKITSFSSPGSWTTVDNGFADIRACYNKIIQKLNTDTNVAYSNYLEVEDTPLLEAVVIDIDKLFNKITLNKTLDFVEGAVTIYNAIDCSIVYTPNTFGDPLSFKQVYQATAMFSDKKFTSAKLAFSTDLLPAFSEVEFDGSSTGLFGHDDFGYNFFGGVSNSVPLRTYVPKDRQRCRYLLVKFQHKVAREEYALYGITLTGRSFSTRAYR